MTITTELAQRMRNLSAEIVENLVDCDGADYEAVEQYLKWTQETLGAFVRAALEAKDKQTADLERDVTKLIEERDSAEEALADMYEAVTGGRPEWSSAFGYDDAVEVVGEKTDAWKDQVHEIDMSNSVLQSQLEARKEQQPVGWTDEVELRDVEKTGCGYLFKADPVSPNADPRRVIKLYREPPAPAPVAVKLPEPLGFRPPSGRPLVLLSDVVSMLSGAGIKIAEGE